MEESLERFGFLRLEILGRREIIVAIRVAIELQDTPEQPLYASRFSW